MERKQWKDLTPPQRAGAAVMLVLQVSLLALAQWDIQHRSADEINGTKGMWRAIALINFIGPLAYFLLGRKKPEAGISQVG